MRLHRNQYMLVFLAQFFAGVNAGVVFQILERNLAPYVAGSVFVLVGLYSIFAFMPRKDLLGRAALIVASLHTFGATVLLSKRLLTSPGQMISDVYGISMELYHQGATYIFYALMILTLILAFKARTSKRKT